MGLQQRLREALNSEARAEQEAKEAAARQREWSARAAVLMAKAKQEAKELRAAEDGPDGLKELRRNLTVAKREAWGLRALLVAQTRQRESLEAQMRTLTKSVQSSQQEVSD